MGIRNVFSVTLCTENATSCPYSSDREITSHVLISYPNINISHQVHHQQLQDLCELHERSRASTRESSLCNRSVLHKSGQGHYFHYPCHIFCHSHTQRARQSWASWLQGSCPVWGTLFLSPTKKRIVIISEIVFSIWDKMSDHSNAMLSSTGTWQTQRTELLDTVCLLENVGLLSRMHVPNLTHSFLQQAYGQ